MTKEKSLKIWLSLSGVLNVFLVVAVVLAWFWKALIGCPQTEGGKIGILKKDIEIGRFDGRNGGKKIFMLPKGLVVRDAHPVGADWFEPYRFQIVVTSEHDDLVDYSPEAVAGTLKHSSHFYSADISHSPSGNSKHKTK